MPRASRQQEEERGENLEFSEKSTFPVVAVTTTFSQLLYADGRKQYASESAMKTKVEAVEVVSTAAIASDATNHAIFRLQRYKNDGTLVGTVASLDTNGNALAARIPKALVFAATDYTDIAIDDLLYAEVQTFGSTALTVGQASMSAELVRH